MEGEQQQPRGMRSYHTTQHHAKPACGCITSHPHPALQHNSPSSSHRLVAAAPTASAPLNAPLALLLIRAPLLSSPL
jgi:hypothetical protein